MAEYFQIGDQTSAIDIVARHPFLTLKIEGRSVVLEDYQIGQNGAGYVVLDGQRFLFRRALDQEHVHLELDGHVLSVTPLGSSEDTNSGEQISDAVLAPMPGVVVDISCVPGQSVNQGDVVITIESMKLQSELRAPRDGVIARIDLTVGATFDRNACLISLEPLIDQIVAV